MNQPESRHEGLRERKRHETLQRVTDSALKLFANSGYEATTLEAIATAAGISRRTFFHYFKSKEEILAVWQMGLPEAFRTAILAEATDQGPLGVVRSAFLKAATRYDASQILVIDQIVRSNEALLASNQTKYLQLEQATFEGLCELWPQTNRRIALRIVAMISVGAMRLAIDNWADQKGRTMLTDHLEEAFSCLKAELSKG